MTLRDFLNKSKAEYESIAYDFPNYSPKFERYYGCSLAFEKLLNRLSDEMLDQTVIWRKSDET